MRAGVLLAIAISAPTTSAALALRPAAPLPAVGNGALVSQRPTRRLFSTQIVRVTRGAAPVLTAPSTLRNTLRGTAAAASGFAAYTARNLCRLCRWRGSVLGSLWVALLFAFAPLSPAYAATAVGSVPFFGRLVYRMKQVVVVHAGLTLAVSVLSILLLGGYAYKRVAKLCFREAAFKAYSLLNDIPGADAVAEEVPGERSVAVSLHMVGVFTFAILLGIVSDRISSSIQDLRSSNARVLESGHTLVFNYGEQTVPILRQLGKARREGRLPNGRVVLLAQVPKEELDARLRDGLRGERYGLSVVTREGSPEELLDMQRVCAGTARRLIVTPPTPADNYGDTLSSCTGLAMSLQSSAFATRESRASLVISSPRNFAAELGQEATRALRSYAEFQPAGFIARLLAQCALTPGISQVYEELLIQGKGSEVYVSHRLKQHPQLQHKTFELAARYFSSGVPLGIVSLDATDAEARVELAPPPSRVLKPTDRLVVLAASKREAMPSPSPGQAASTKQLKPQKASTGAVPSEERGALATVEATEAELEAAAAPRHVVLLNSNSEAADIIKELSEILPKGSRVTLIADEPLSSDIKQLRLKRGFLQVVRGDTASAADLRDARAHSADCVMVLQRRQSGGSDDAQSLLSLHALAEALRHSGRSLNDAGAPRVVGALSEPQMEQLISEQWPGVTNDLLLPNELISGAMVQFAIQPSLRVVYDQLLTKAGKEIYMRHADAYVDLSEGSELQVSFNELALAARQRGEVLIGVQRAEDTAPLLNPRGKARPMRMQKGDQLVLLGDAF